MITTKEAWDILIKLEDDVREAILAKVKSLDYIDGDEFWFDEENEFAPDKDDRETIKGFYYDEATGIEVVVEDCEGEETTYNLGSDIWTPTDLIQLLEVINKK